MLPTSAIKLDGTVGDHSDIERHRFLVWTDKHDAAHIKLKIDTSAIRSEADEAE